MDSMILIVSAAVVLLLGIIAVILTLTGGKKKRRSPKKKGNASLKKAVDIDPSELCKKISQMAPSASKAAKEKYRGRLVEVRTILSSSKGSKKGSSYREVVLD